VGMSQPIEPSRRIELERPSRGRTFRSISAMRVRLILDRVLHRPPQARRVERNIRMGAQKLLGLPSTDFDALWEEARGSRLEERISAQLHERFPKGAPVPLIASPEGAWLDILRFIYVLVRVSKPAHAVETGVGPVGATTAFILEAMRANGAGHLWSLDAGHYLSVYGVEPGNGIPEELRDRHTLLIAEARGQLQRVMDQCVPPVGLFLHDSEHTYANMTFEFSVVWPRLARAGYVLSDDSHNNAPDRFGARVRVPPMFLEYGGTHFGILQKP